MKALSLVLALTFAGPAATASADWRRDARPEDVRRYEDLDRAWTEALRQAREAGYGAQVSKLGALTDRRVALSRPQPTPGAYRCRTVKLGTPSGQGLPFVAYGWFRCRVELTPGGDLILAKTTGSQRPYGNLYPQGPRRLAYLGAVAWGQEGLVRYGENPERDQVGAFERIGRDRYRLVLPYPKQESVLDLIELAK
jgi:hypothetical protein